MNILGIETSCDETAAAIVQDGRHILSNVVVSQIDIFKAYGGVIPEIAARSHLEAILSVIHQAINQAKLHWSDLDAIAVTHTPGLLGSLLIGTLTARTLALLHHKPLYPIHHLKSHLYAAWLEPLTQPPSSLQASSSLSSFLSSSEVSSFQTQPAFPLLALIVSGGHTQIIQIKNHRTFKIIGTTRDDAVGECFDKVAKILGLPYPGGPAIAQAAKLGNPHRYHFPHPKVPDLDFSFSGLKTAVLRAIQQAVDRPISFPSHQLAPLLSQPQIADFAASFQHTAIDILLEKLSIALTFYPETQSLIIAGGVSANQLLRQMTYLRFPQPHSPQLFFPEPRFSGDNAAMVAAAAFYEIQSGVKPTDPFNLNILPRSAIS